ncbi:MAG: AAA family ATPase, partial [Deltaproteobacteria bacterium]|nr:AAA family ATPase [Deltaproteobacteria bacterium]
MKTPLQSIPAAAWAADLHVHSHFSRATARNLEPGQIALWAARKGLRLVGSGDLTHPGWLEELSQRLVPAPSEEGLFALREAKGEEAKVRFLLSGEISCIYKKNQRVRKVHVVVLMPSFEAAKKFNSALPASCNLTSDGRPILGLDAKLILELVLATDPLAELIPAHIWTPWFSVLGSKSGFDDLEECFEDLSSHVHAAETGLSSDPPMNWRVSSLDRFHLISSSDAHSPANLAREATMFSTGLSYPEIIAALRTGEGLAGTLEFFPEEGKYHLDGHRACQVRLEPRETAARGGLCPVCHKPVTVGVLNRVEALADRPEGFQPPRARPFESLLGLAQVLGQVLGVGPKTKKVARLYDPLISDLGSELHVLRQAPLEEIERSAGPVAA